MAEKIIIELDLEKGDVTGATKSLEKSAEKSGKKSGKDFAKEFNKNAGEKLGSLTKTLAKATAAATALGGALATAIGFKSVQAAKVQEDAVKRLNVALRESGSFSLEASEDLQSYAAELQKTTRFGDELLINQIALAKSFGASNDQAKKITETATGLSVAFGIDLESATRNVAKTLGGFAGELGEVIPDIKLLTQEQLKAGAGIDLLSSKFANQGKNLNTFSFFQGQIANSFGDILEEIGNIITKSPVILKAMQQLIGIFISAGSSVKDFASNLNLIDDALIPLSNFADIIITFVVAPLELMKNILVTLQGGLNTFVSAVIAGFGRLAEGAGTIIQLFSPDSEVATALRDFAETSAQVFSETLGETAKSLDAITDFEVSDKLATKNEEMREGLIALNQTIAEESALAQAELDASLNASVEKSGEALVNTGEKTKEQLEQIKKQANAIVKNGIVNSISGGIQNIVKSLAAGENVFQNFGNFLLSTFGDLAIQLGQFFIAQGIAITALRDVSGAGTIAAGAGLVALGAILKSFTSSGGKSSSGGGVAAVGAQPGAGEFSTPGLAEPESVAEAEERVNLSLNIEGSLVRESELQGFVSNLLEEGSSSNANIIPSLRTGIA